MELPFQAHYGKVTWARCATPAVRGMRQRMPARRARPPAPNSGCGGAHPGSVRLQRSALRGEPSAAESSGARSEVQLPSCPRHVG